MDYRKEFERMMKSQTEIALATAGDGEPNVRIVNFYYDSHLKTLYFSTFGDNQKVLEIENNLHVAFTTIPLGGEEHVRVKNALARISPVAIEKIKEKFLNKIPDYIMSIPDIIPDLILFEIVLDHADVVVDFEHMETITL